MSCSTRQVLPLLSFHCLLLPVGAQTLKLSSSYTVPIMQRERSTSEHVVVYTSADKADVAATLASELVQRRLAACVKTLPSVWGMYRWKGKIKSGTDHLLIIETRAELVDELTAVVKELHPYETAEVIALPIVGGLEEYTKWINASTKESEGKLKPS